MEIKVRVVIKFVNNEMGVRVIRLIPDSRQECTLRNDTELNSVALVRTRTIPTERPPPIGEVSANFCG